MGCSSSSPSISETRIQDNPRIDRVLSIELTAARKKKDRIFQCIVTGEAHVGKSTFLKHLDYTHTTLIPPHLATRVIFQFVQSVFARILESATSEMSDGMEDNEKCDERSDIAWLCFAQLKDICAFDSLTGECARLMTLFWQSNTARIGAVLPFPALLEAVGYYVANGRLEAFALGQTPNRLDVLKSMEETIGVEEIGVKNPNREDPCHFVNCGMAMPSPKCTSFFEEFTSVIHIIDISVYDCHAIYYDDCGFDEPFASKEAAVILKDSRLRHLSVDHTANALVQQLASLRQLANCQMLEDLLFIVFLNKRDIFKRKLETERKPLTVCFPDFTGDPFDFEECIEELRRESRDGCVGLHEYIYHHVTDLMDEQRSERVMHDCWFLFVNERFTNSWMF